MISQAYKDLARWAMDFALKNGCSASRIAIYTGSNDSFEYRNTQLDELKRASENKMDMEFFVDGRSAAFSTNRLVKAELEKFILNGIANTRFLAPDPLRQLPDPSRYYKGDGSGLKCFDPAHEKVTADEKIQLIKSTVNEIYGSDPRLISVSAGFDSRVSNSFKIASNGFQGEMESTSFSIGSEVSMKGDGDARPSNGWYESALFWDKLVKTGVGKTAYERTVRKLGQSKLESAVYPMLLDNTQSSRIISPLLSALSGSSLQQKQSFLINKIGEKIFSDKFTLVDDPHIPGAPGARWFDGEGVATKKRTVIENGVLKMYFIDNYSALKMKMEPTVQSSSTLTCTHGSKNFDQLLASLDKGIWVTGFNGGNSNPTTGDFSFGIEGFLIENGKVTKPINEMNITGNLLALWKNVAEVGNDPRLSSSWRIPSVLINSVNFSGK